MAKRLHGVCRQWAFCAPLLLQDLLQVSSELGRKARPLSCQWLCSEVHAIRHQGVVVRYALKAALLGH